MFGHLGSFKGWIQTEARVIPSYHGMLIIMCICSDRLAVQDCEMHYMNAWLKRCVFNLDLNRESVSEPRTLSGRVFHSLGARYEKVLPPLVDFAILGTTKSPEFCDLRERVGL